LGTTVRSSRRLKAVRLRVGVVLERGPPAEPVWLVRIALILVLVGFTAFVAH